MAPRQQVFYYSAVRCRIITENILAKVCPVTKKNGLAALLSLATADAAETSDDRFDAYRAPEAYISSRFVTPAADVYSLCAAIYTTVTGYVPESVENVLFNREAKPIWDVINIAASKQ